VIDRDGSGKNFKFFELVVAIVYNIFCVDLLEESGVFLNLGSLFEQCVLAVDLFYLFGFEVLLALQFCDFCEFFVDVAHLLLERPEERFILLVYSLGFDFRVLTFLWLWFF